MSKKTYDLKHATGTTHTKLDLFSQYGVLIFYSIWAWRTQAWQVWLVEEEENKNDLIVRKGR